MIELWFPTPVYFEDAPQEEYAGILAEFCAAEAKIKASLEDNTWGDNISTTFNQYSLFDEYKLTRLKSFVTTHAQRFMTAFAENRNVKLDNSWVNYQRQHQFQERHIHPGYFLSGVFYMRTTGDDGALRFFAPDDKRQEHLWANLLFQNTQIEYQPKAGRIILFPSSAPHGVRANLTGGERVSIAFNFHLA